MQSYQLEGKKIGARSMKSYRTTIEIACSRCKVTSYIKGDCPKVSEFNCSDIKEVKYCLSPIVNTIDIIRFIIAAFLLVEPLLGIFAFAFFYYYTLIKTAKIMLTTGEVIKVYYSNKDEAETVIDSISKIGV